MDVSVINIFILVYLLMTRFHDEVFACGSKRISCVSKTSYKFCFTVGEKVMEIGNIKHCRENTICDENEGIVPCIFKLTNNTYIEINTDKPKEIVSETSEDMLVAPVTDSSTFISAGIVPEEFSTTASTNADVLSDYYDTDNFPTENWEHVEKITNYNEGSDVEVNIIKLNTLDSITHFDPYVEQLKTPEFHETPLSVDENMFSSSKSAIPHEYTTTELNQFTEHFDKSSYIPNMKSQIETTTNTMLSHILIKENTTSASISLSTIIPTKHSDESLEQNKFDLLSNNINKAKTTALNEEPTLVPSNPKPENKFSGYTESIPNSMMSPVFVKSVTTIPVLYTYASTNPPDIASQLDIVSAESKLNILNTNIIYNIKYKTDIKYDFYFGKHPEWISEDSVSKERESNLTELENVTNLEGMENVYMKGTSTTSPVTKEIVNNFLDVQPVTYHTALNEENDQQLPHLENTSTFSTQRSESSYTPTSTSSGLHLKNWDFISTTAVPRTTAPTPVCRYPGKYPLKYCNQYYECIRIMWWIQAKIRICPYGEAFDSITSTCQPSNTCQDGKPYYLL